MYRRTQCYHHPHPHTHPHTHTPVCTLACIPYCFGYALVHSLCIKLVIATLYDAQPSLISVCATHYYDLHTDVRAPLIVSTGSANMPHEDEVNKLVFAKLCMVAAHVVLESLPIPSIVACVFFLFFKLLSATTFGYYELDLRQHTCGHHFRGGCGEPTGRRVIAKTTKGYQRLTETLPGHYCIALVAISKKCKITARRVKHSLYQTLRPVRL